MARARRLLIIGAGPIGLEAALYAAHLGYEVRVLERGGVGENVLSWGHVRMFSPWGMNGSSLGLAVLSRDGARPYADGREAPTGRDYVTRYLQPLCASRPLRGVVRERTRVVAISRHATAKQDLPGDPARALRPFRVLAARAGREEIHEADLVIDATGTYGQPRPLGNGGIAAPGETAADPLIDRGIPDLADARVAVRFAGRKILLVGAGHSAATSAIGLATLAERHPRTRVLWAFRATRTPLYPRIAKDLLTHRDILCAQANQIARGSDPHIEPCPGSLVESIARARRNGGGRIQVSLRRDGRIRRVRVDRIIANVGYTPDASIHSELQVNLCYATGGPIRLAAALLATGGGDCLAPVRSDGGLLSHPEPGFYILGSKSYGRNSSFLIRAGLDQIRSLFATLAGDEHLDLYDASPGRMLAGSGNGEPAVPQKSRTPPPQVRA